MIRFSKSKDRNIITGPSAYIFVMQAVFLGNRKLPAGVGTVFKSDAVQKWRLIWKRIEIYVKTEGYIRYI